MLINTMKPGLYLCQANVQDVRKNGFAESFCCTCKAHVPITNLTVAIGKTFARVQSFCEACGEEMFLFAGHETDSETEKKLKARIAELENQVSTLTDTAMAELHLSLEDKAGF